jgi:hypothetical protein
MDELIVLITVQVGALHAGTNRTYMTTFFAGERLHNVTALGHTDVWVLILESASGMQISFPQGSVHIFSSADDSGGKSHAFGERN